MVSVAAAIVSAPHLDCVSPDRTSEDLLALKARLVDLARSLRVASDHYALLAGETRLKIMVLLDETPELCVCDLATILEMTPAAVSQHLSRLRSGRLVHSRRDGMTIYYRLVDTMDRTLLAPVLGMRRPEEE
jgi:DNA-binding transcriptional ArsR family regulator